MDKPKIILITGKARHGKDTFATYLRSALNDMGKSVLRTAFADRVKDIAKDEYNWNGKKDYYGRNLLQLVGDGFRHIHGENYWIKEVENKIIDSDDAVIISDCRYINETNYFEKNDYDQYIIKVKRFNPDGTLFDNGLSEGQKEHPSEKEINEIKPDIIVKNKHIDTLMKQAQEVANIVFPPYNGYEVATTNSESQYNYFS